MFLQRYVHVVLDAVLGSYVKNIDPAALQISVWNGKIEVEALELQPDAFPLPKQLRLVKGTLRQLRIDLPWSNLANQPIRVDIQDVSLLLQVGVDDRSRDSEPSAEEKRRQVRQKLQKLQRKRAAIDAVEKATEFNEKNNPQGTAGQQSYTQSFLFKLLVKALDNVQVHVQHLHLRMEDTVSDPRHPYAVGMTLEAIIIKSADEGWNYTMVGRGGTSQGERDLSFLRKKMDINKFGIYWSLPLVPVPLSVLNDAEAFANLMRSNFSTAKALAPGLAENIPPASGSIGKGPTLSLFKHSDYVIHPLTVTMKLTVNDGNAKLPITHQELSNRVLSRLGTPWMVETINAIGDDAWNEFLEMMPKLAGERKYTLGFVFSEAWSVARDLTEEEDEIPSVVQFKEALSSCMQWSLEEVDRVEQCIVKYREAVVHVMEEKSTYVDAQASIDQISTSLNRQQYLSALSFISFVTVNRRQARYLVLRPKRVRVKDNPMAWWKYAIDAVLLDVRERLAHVDWEAQKKIQQQQCRYKELYLMLEHGNTYAATQVSSELRLLPKEMARNEFDELELSIDVKELIYLRRSVRGDIADKKKQQEVISKKQGQHDGTDTVALPTSSDIPASSRLWSYASWLTGSGAGAQGESPRFGATSRSGGVVSVEDVKWSDQDTKDLYEAIDFHPEENGKDNRAAENGKAEDFAARTKRLLREHQHILYRFQLSLSKASFGLSLGDIYPYRNGLSLRYGSERITPHGSVPSHLMASLEDVDIQFLVRPSCIEVGLQLRDAFFCQNTQLSLNDRHSHRKRSVSSSGTDFFLQRMDMDEVLEYHPAGVRNQMSSVRLRHCEKDLPLIQLSIESEHQPPVDPGSDCENKKDRGDMTAVDDTLTAHLLRISLVTQAIKCNVNLMFLLDVVAVFSRPVNVDLSGLEHSAWKRAQSLQRYSAAQLRDALARRTKVDMSLDVISPLINIIQAPPQDSGIPTGDEVSLLLFLGHLKALTKHPGDKYDEIDAAGGGGEHDRESTASRMIALAASDVSLYDVLEISISGIEVQIIGGGDGGASGGLFRARNHFPKKASWHYLLEKTSLSFSFYMSITPDDPRIPLLKLFGGVDSVNLNLSATSFRALLQLLRSFGDNFSVDAQRRNGRKIAISEDLTNQSSAHSGLAPDTRRRSTPKLVRKTSSYIQPGAALLPSSGSSGKQGGVSDNNSYVDFANKMQREWRKIPAEKDVDDQDLLKLWKRVICHLQFGVKEITLTLKVCDIENGSGKIVCVRAVDINTRLKVRSYDRRLEFALGTFLVEDIILSKTAPSLKIVEKKRFLVKSGNHGAVTELQENQVEANHLFAKPPTSSEQLIHVAITSIASDAVMPKSKSLWKNIRHAPLSASFNKNSVWQDPLITSLSIDASLRVLTIDVYQDTLAEVFVFFFKNKSDEISEGLELEDSLPPPPSSQHSASEGSASDTKKMTADLEGQSVMSSVEAEAIEETFSKKLGVWMASSFIEKVPAANSECGTVEVAPTDTCDGNEEELPASMQLRLHVEGLSLFLHLDDNQRPEGMHSAFVSLTAQQFCCCIQRFPRYLSTFTYLTSLKICDISLTEQHLSEIVSHGNASTVSNGDSDDLHRFTIEKYDGGSAVGHVPTLDEILNMLNDAPAVFSCAAQFYGADRIQEAWHPGYSSRFSVRLRSPRIRFLYSFVDDMRNYWIKGVLLETVLSILSQEQADMLWEGDFQLGGIQDSPSQMQVNEDEMPSGEFLGSDVVSMFPLVDIRLDDTVLEMPPHRMSSESLLLRFDNFRISNEDMVNSFLGMDNRIVAKVLLNSSLKQIQLDMKALRIVSVILVDREDVDKRMGTSGFITQSLLGLTDFALSVDFRSHADVKLNLTYTPIRLVCNQEQYAFVLRVPLQNYRERSRYQFSEGANTPGKAIALSSARRFSFSRSIDAVSMASSSGRKVEDYDEVSNGARSSLEMCESEERHILLDVHVPEITMEILRGQNGYHPSSSGDLDMAERGKINDGSICVLLFSAFSGRSDYNLTSGKLAVNIDLEGVHVRDSRVNSKMSTSYRDVVVFEQRKEGIAKAISLQFGRETFEVNFAAVGFDATFATHAQGLRTPRTQFRSVSSRTFGGLFGSDFSLRRTDSEMSVSSPMSSTIGSNGANSSGRTGEENFPSVVGIEGRMDFIIDIAGFKVIPSNIHYDVLRFLEMPLAWSDGDENSVGNRDEIGACEEHKYASDEKDEVYNRKEVEEIPPTYRRISLELNLGPSALLLVEDPHKLKSRALMLSWEASIALNYVRQANEEASLVAGNKDSGPTMHSHNQLQFCVALENMHATSRLSEESVWATEQAATATSADCLKPIDMESVFQMDLRSRFTRFRTTFDRVMELRFGYLDFCMMLASLEHILRRPAIVTPSVVQGGQKRRSMSGSSISSEDSSSWSDRHRSTSSPSPSVSWPSSKDRESQRTAALYGTSLIYLVSASFRGRLETRPVVGFYSSTWRKRYLVLPYTAHQRQLVQSVAFRILPAHGSRRDIGDKIYYGDRIILEAVVKENNNNNEKRNKEHQSPKEDTASPPSPRDRTVLKEVVQSSVVRKYDQLGAIGYLGPEGSAGVFETTIWKHGSTMFNSDKSVIYDREVIVFEELTIYRSFSKGKKFGGSDAAGQQMDFNSARSGGQTEGAHTVDAIGARGGGYLMFNGVGDAPIPFALSIVSADVSTSKHEEQSAISADDMTDTMEEAQTTSRRKKQRKSLFAYASFLENLKIIEFTLPGVNATVVNDFHNMLLPLLHFRVATLHADVRGRMEDKFTALASLRFGIQAYNSQLAVWEPVLEDFEVNMAFHGKGGVLCDYCMSERQSVSPTGAVLRCNGMPLCLFRSSRTEVFTNAAAHSWEAKNFIYREILEQPDGQDGAKQANTFMIVVKDDFNINISRNVINVLVHFVALVTKVTAADEALSSRLGPFIYVDNQSGIPFVVATHPSSSAIGAPAPSETPSSSRRATGSIEMPTDVPGADTNDDIMKAGAALFNSNAWSRRRLSTMLNDISSSNTKWIRVESGERIATDIVAHEAPAGCVTSPLRRLLWLKPQSTSQRTTSAKAIPVPIGYSNRSYLHLESNGQHRDSWHGESIICETVAEQGTLVLRLRGKVQLTNLFGVPIQVIYDDIGEETIEPDGKAPHYIPIQYLEAGTIAFRPLLTNGKVQRSNALSIASLLRSNDTNAHSRSNRRRNVGSLELRKALTFYWDVHPTATAEGCGGADLSFGVSLPPFQVILTALRKSERHETTITLRPPVVIENLLPYELSYRTVCMKSEAEAVWVAKNAASFSGTSGKVSSGSSACIAELEVLEQDLDNGVVVQIPTVVGLSLALPQIQLRRFSRWSREAFIYGCQSFCERIELNMRDDSELEAPTPANKLTICVEITQLEKLRSRALNALAPVVCRVFTEYWLIDRTSLSLAFYTDDNYLIPSNHPGCLSVDNGNVEDESPVSLSLFSCENKQSVSKMKIGIKGDKGEREVQSEPFDISAVGVRGQILVPTNRSRDARSFLSTIAEFGTLSDGPKSTFKQYEFGVMIENGPAKFSRSRVVTLVPRYYLINSSNRFEIHIRQECSTGDSSVLVIRPKETKIFHWSDSRLPSRVQICFVLPDKRHEANNTFSYTNSSQWSAPFELSSVGNFVLRVKSKVRPAPPCLPECYEGSLPRFDYPEEEKGTHFFFGEEDEYGEADRMLAKGIQLNVSVELHDPSFLVYLEEGGQAIQFPLSSSYGYEQNGQEHPQTVETDANKGFVPYKIKNECSNLELIVWQKTIVKDGKGNVTIGFEGGESVLPFHTIDYVPFRFSAFPTVFIQVQKMAGLDIGALRKEQLPHTRHQNKVNSKAAGENADICAPVSALSRAAVVGQTQVVASFEVQLKKLQRLPTLDVSEGTTKKRLWAEVLLDETTKTLLVTDMLPGFSGEHKRRRRATLLRSWKQYNTSIVFISRVLEAHTAQLTKRSANCDDAEDVSVKKKRVRFATDAQDVKKMRTASQKPASANGARQGDTDGDTIVLAGDQEDAEALALCVRLIDATYLENVFLQAGRNDLASCQPFIIFSLKTEDEETRIKLRGQTTTVFPRWVPESNSKALLSALILRKDDTLTGSSHDIGSNVEIMIEIREADMLFGSSLVAVARIPLQEYCAAAMITAKSEGNDEPQVVEFLAPVRVVRKGGDRSQTTENETRIRLQMCCRRTLATRSDVATAGGSVGIGTQLNETVKELTDVLSAYQVLNDLRVLVSAKSQLKLLLELEAVDTSTSGNDVPVASRPDISSVADSKYSDLSGFVDRATGTKEETTGTRGRSMGSARGSAISMTTDESISDGTYEEMGDEKRLTAVLIGVSNLQIPTDIVRGNFKHKHGPMEHLEPKVYCTITYQESTRSALSAVAKRSSLSSATKEQCERDDTESLIPTENLSIPGSPSNNPHYQQVRTHEFPRGKMLGLDLVYRNGRVLVQGVVCDGPCGLLVYEGKIRIGDTVVAVNSKSIVNLHRDASFAVIEKVMRWGEDADLHTETKTSAATFTLSFLYQPTTPERSTFNESRPSCAQAADEEFGAYKYDAEWNRRVEFAETTNSKSEAGSCEEQVLVRVYLRNESSDHGLSASQESSIVPFLYFFGDDATMDHLDHSKQDSRFDVLLAECWVPLPPSSLSTASNPMSTDGYSTAPSALTFNERICGLYSPRQRSHQHSALEIIGQLRLALKWDFVNPFRAAHQHADLNLNFQLEVARISISVVDDGSWSSAMSGAAPQQPQEVLCISLSDQNASAGVQLSYAQMSDGKQVINARVGHFQVDNQLLDTNYPVLLRPIRLLDAQMQEEGIGISSESGGKSKLAEGAEKTGPTLLPTVQLMTVFSRQPNVIQFDYIFGQLQELEIKLEDATLVVLAYVFSGVEWSNAGPSTRAHDRRTSGKDHRGDNFGSNLALQLLEIEWSTPTVQSTAAGGSLGNTRSGGGANMKVLLRWLLLCPVKVNVTFTSTADRSLLLSLLSPDMSSVLSTLISAAAALVSNLDQAPIRVPEFYVENLLETTHTLAFYAMQHYLHHGLRSWYSIMGSVDFLGNPIGLVSTLGTGVKDFFYTPAQMLLEDEEGLRIENLRTGMTKGSKSLLRNTAVGIFHTTGKITETLGKGIALLAMDEQYNVQRQRASTRQVKKINDMGDAIAEGSKGLVGGVWDGIKGVVAAPVRGAEQDGAGGFVVGIGKGVAGLIVKPTAGFLDLLTSLSRGAKTSAESLDGTDRAMFDMITRFRLPRRICSDGVLVSYSERESRGYAVLLLTSLEATDDYVYHVDYGIEPHRGLVLLTDKRLICLSGKTGQKLWEVALDSTLDVAVDGSTLKIGQTTSPSRSYNIECDNELAATNFRVAADSARVDVSATRYLLLNLEKSQEESRIGSGGRVHIGGVANEEERMDLHVLMENVQDTMVSGVSGDDLRSQPLRSVRVEVCHLQNKDAHANVPNRAIDKVLSFSVFQIQAYGGPYQWIVFRRFSEFRELCARLVATGYTLEGLPPLPPRTFLPSTRSSVAKHRQETLNVFLQAAIMHSTISRSVPMLEFLTREAREVRVSLPPLSPTAEKETARLAGDSP